MDIPRAHFHTSVPSTTLFSPDNDAKSDCEASSNFESIIFASDNSSKNEGRKVKKLRTDGGIERDFKSSSEVFYPDHVSSTDATFTHTHSSLSEERFERISVSSKLRRSNSKNKKTPDSLSIIWNSSRGAVWKKVKASTLKDLNGLDKNKLEKIAFKTGIEVDWINVGGTDTKGALMERVREWITEEMDR